jgi:hypothetical protein
MYLEISARQTGKTSRMINQIYADKEKYDVQILMGMNWISLKSIKSKIKRNSKVKICLSFDAIKKLLTKCEDKKIKLYVDEFLYSNAFINNFKEIQEIYERKFFLLSNGYFSSSINTNNYSILRELQLLTNEEIYSMIVSNRQPI